MKYGNGNGGPLNGRKTPEQDNGPSAQDIAMLAKALRKAEGLLARTDEEVKALREGLLRSPSQQHAQLLANFEAVQSLQTAHRDHLIQRLREAKGCLVGNGRAQRPLKEPVVLDFGQRIVA